MDKIITIKGGGYEAKINASRGANCFSLICTEQNVSVLRVPDYSKPLDNVYLYGMPVLFPQNRISGGRFEFEGRTYDFGINEPSTGCFIHGVLHSLPFDVVDCADDFAVLRYESKGGYVGYSENFAVTLTYRLSGDGLLLESEIENLSDNNLPITFGFHTTFNLPFAQGSSAEDVKILAEIEDEIERDMSVYLPTGRIVPFDHVSRAINDGEFRSTTPISRHYKVGSSGKIEMRDQRAGVTLCYENDEKFKFRLIYNGNADGFICIEPISSVADSPNCSLGREYGGFDYVPIGGKKQYYSKIYLKKG